MVSTDATMGRMPLLPQRIIKQFHTTASIRWLVWHDGRHSHVNKACVFAMLLFQLDLPILLHKYVGTRKC